MLASSAFVVAGQTAPAQAAAPGVSITPQSVVITAAGAGAMITRSPFSMTFQDGSGATVLSEVASAGSVSHAVSQSTPMPSPATYAPIVFLVGTRTSTTSDSVSPLYQGNSTGGSLSGTEYAATSVVSAVQQGAGAKITMATSDPSGRQIILTVTPNAAGTAMQVSAAASPSTGVVAISDSFNSSTTEAFHGFGGRHNALDQHGQNFYNWNEEEFNQTDLTTTNLTPTPNGSKAAYFSQPYFVSSNPYAFLVNDFEMSSFRLDTDNASKWQTSVAKNQLNYTVAPGPAPQAIATMTNYLGRQRVAPAWAMGAGSGASLDSAATTTSGAGPYKTMLNNDIAAIKANNVKLSYFVINQWWYLTTAELKSYVAQFNALGIHTVVYFKALLDFLGIGYDSSNDFWNAWFSGYFPPSGGANMYNVDFTNPAAVTWWKNRITAALSTGVDGFMLDFGEQVGTNWKFKNGQTGEQLHNQYPVLYQQYTRQAVDAFQAANPSRQIWFYTRSGYTGSTAYDGGNFPGDESKDFGRANGLASLTTTMLNMSVGGASGFTTNIGGYLEQGLPTGPCPTPNAQISPDLYQRWLEWAALSPFFRIHNSQCSGVQQPWSDPNVLATFKATAALHARASNYIRTQWQQAVSDGTPLTKPLWLAYPNDTTAARQDQEWLLGPNVLVAPVVTANATSRSVYLPSGCWVDQNSQQTINGPTTVTASAPANTLPYYFKCGTTPF